MWRISKKLDLLKKSVYMYMDITELLSTETKYAILKNEKKIINHNKE